MKAEGRRPARRTGGQHVQVQGLGDIIIGPPSTSSFPGPWLLEVGPRRQAARLQEKVAGLVCRAEFLFSSLRHGRFPGWGDAQKGQTGSHRRAVNVKERVLPSLFGGEKGRHARDGHRLEKDILHLMFKEEAFGVPI